MNPPIYMPGVSEKYATGSSVASLALLYDCSEHAVYGALHRDGVCLRGRDLIGREAETLYRKGLSLSQVGRSLGRRATSVANYLRRHHVPMRRGTPRKYALNEHAFDVITEESAYWCGFLMADGCVHYRRNLPTLTLALATQDKDHLERFRSFLGTNRPLQPYGGSKPRAFALAIDSRRLCESLVRLGVTPKKTHHGATSTVLAKDPNFWRGVMDGDGSLTPMRPGRSPGLYLACCAYKLLRQFSRFCEYIGMTRPPIRSYQKNTGIVFLTARRAALLAAALYQDARVFLPRKMDRARAMFGYRGRSLSWAL